MTETKVNGDEAVFDQNILNKRKYRLLPQVTQNSTNILVINIHTYICIIYYTMAVECEILCWTVVVADVVRCSERVRSDITKL